MRLGFDVLPLNRNIDSAKVVAGVGNDPGPGNAVDDVIAAGGISSTAKLFQFFLD